MGSNDYAKWGIAIALAIFFIVLIILDIWVLADIVPAEPDGERIGTIAPEALGEFLKLKNVDQDAHLIYIVIFSGSLGGLIHGLASLSKRTRESKFIKKDVFFYVEKPFVGAAIALLVYVAFRGGVLTATADLDPLNPYGMATVSAVAGLLGDRATRKIRDIVEVLFGFAKVEDRKSGE